MINNKFGEMDKILKDYHNDSSLDIYKTGGLGVQSLAEYASARGFVHDEIPEMSGEEYLDWYDKSKTKSEAEFLQYAEGLRSGWRKFKANVKTTFRLKMTDDMKQKALDFFATFNPTIKNGWFNAEYARLMKEFAERACDDFVVVLNDVKPTSERGEDFIKYQYTEDFRAIGEILKRFYNEKHKKSASDVKDFRFVAYVMCHWKDIVNEEIRTNTALKVSRAEFTEAQVPSVSVNVNTCPPPEVIAEKKFETSISESKVDNCIPKSVVSEGKIEETISEGHLTYDNEIIVNVQIQNKKNLYESMNRRDLSIVKGFFEGMLEDLEKYAEETKDEALLEKARLAKKAVDIEKIIITCYMGGDV